MVDLGIFEIPNMLGVDGKEPGTVGLRHFLELGYSEALRAFRQARDDERAYRHPNELSPLSSSETLKALKYDTGTAAIGKRAPKQNRYRLIREGPRSWRKVGVREVETSVIIDRLCHISHWHDQILNENWKISALDKQTCMQLYKFIFENLLFPPDHIIAERNPYGLKVQIEALVKVLTTPGAWIDFSLPESRLTLGQVLWSQPVYDDTSTAGESPLPPGGERKWLLVQLLLAIELCLRLDAALRVSVAEKSDKFHLSATEIHHFNKLRNSKVDWDVVVARRFLDAIYVKRHPHNLPRPSVDEAVHTSRILSHFKRGLTIEDKHQYLSIWDCAVLPRVPKLQIDGLARFAQVIGWPNVESLKTAVSSKLLDSPASLEHIFSSPVPAGEHDDETPAGPAKLERDSTEIECFHLQRASDQQPGGWLSRTWLSGLVLPGRATAELLMLCLLENDSSAAAKLQNKAFPHTGFVLDGRSWWYKSSVAGRVLAPSEGGSQSMGWIATPKIQPHSSDGQAMDNCWIAVAVRARPARRDGLRIHDGPQVSEDSNPLGIGQGKIFGNEFVMVTDQKLDHLPEIDIHLTEFLVDCQAQSGTGVRTGPGSLTFNWRSPEDPSEQMRRVRLRHDVYFVTAHPCLLPHGHTISSADREHLDLHHLHPTERLPAHPLHTTYKFQAKSLLDLPATIPPNLTKRDGEVLIVDARWRADRDIFARAWCAEIGLNALVARVGRTCLSCAIREAKALEIGVVIRVCGALREVQTTSTA